MKQRNNSGPGVFRIFRITYASFITGLPSRYLLLVLLSLMPALISPARIYLESLIFNSAARMGESRQLLQYFVVFVCVQLLYVVVYPQFRSNVNYVGSEFETLLQNRMNEKTARIPLEDYETNALHKDIELASSASRDLRFMTMMFSSEILLYLFQFLSVSGVLFTFHPSLILLSLLSILPDIFARIVNSRRQVALLDKTAPISRRKQYFAELLSAPASLKEIRTLGSGAFFLNKWEGERSRYNQENRTLVQKNTFTNLLIQCVHLLTMVLTYGLIIWLSLTDWISIGEFGAALSAAATLKMNFGRVCNLLLFSLMDCGQKGTYYYRVLAHRERDGKTGPRPPVEEGVRLEGVCFSYPEGGQVLKDVSFSVAPGETVAIVGENGAGKTTLVKVLLGLYRPDRGRVTYGGVDIAGLREEDVTPCSSAVFQDFPKYCLTLKENVAMGYTAAPMDWERAEALLKEVGFRGGTLAPDTMLGREFGGEELSGGNWQKLAIARGLYRPHEIIALDEPTAAIDPLVEDSILNSLVQLDQGKLKLMVTHRLNTTRFADKILVLDKGQLVGCGSHEALLGTNEIYSRLWAAQAQWYSGQSV